MKSLEKWQFISFISRMSAMAFGILQSFAILRILSVSDWGLIQLVVSVGMSLGIYQHLGLAGASNREIAASEKRTDIFKIFITTLSVRYLVTIPLSLGLYYFAPRIAQVYGFNDIVVPLRIYAVVIFIQGCQAILNAVISGTKRFKELFIFQAVIALASVLIYVPMVYYYKVMGFFYALLIHEGIKSLVLLIIAFKPYLKKLTLPTKEEFIKIFKELFSLGMAIYLVKIIVINWEKAGPNLLGFMKDAELIGIFSFALLFAKKLMHVSDAITDVNLPVFSGKYAENIGEFKKLFTENFNKVFTMIVFFAMTAVFWAPELIKIVIGGNKYDPAIPLLFPMVFAFIFFSLIDILKSSVAIPAKLTKEMVAGFLVMLLATLGIYFLGKETFTALNAMAYAMLGGAFLGFITLVMLFQNKLKFNIVQTAHLLVIIQAFVITTGSVLGVFGIKIVAYLLNVFLYVLLVIHAKFISTHDLNVVIDKSLKFLKVR